MKKLFLSALIVAVGSFGVATAAQWNGPYIGLDAGYSKGTAKQPYGAHGAAFTLTEASADLKGWTAGAHAGWNWSNTGWLFGLEAAGNWTNIKGDDGGSGGGGDINGIKGNAEASATGRLGFFTGPHTLIYGRFGYSWLNADVVKLNGSQVIKTSTFRGPVYAAGVEFSVAPATTARIEYRMNRYGERRVNMSPLGYDLGITNSVNTLSVGLSWAL